VLLASGTARTMTERPDDHRLLAQYLAEVRKKPLLTPAQELALGEQKKAGAKARQQVTSTAWRKKEPLLCMTFLAYHDSIRSDYPA